jgi:hypothetical protein
MNVLTASEPRIDANKGSDPQPVVRLGAVGTWLDAPLAGPEFSDDGLPDPIARWGRHVRWAFLAGSPVSHSEWARTHDGQCPRGCGLISEVPHANPFAASPAWDAWQAFLRGCRGPIEPEPQPSLRQRGGWNAHSCIVPEEPLVVMPMQPIQGDPYQ